jgi:hypothetical protein
MTAESKIKIFLKEQIQKGRINTSDIMKLEPSHLLKTKSLQGIDKEIVADTLQEIKYKINPDLLSNDIGRIVQQDNNPLADQIAAIMDGHE